MAVIDQDVDLWAGDTTKLVFTVSGTLTAPTAEWVLAPSAYSAAVLTKSGVSMAQSGGAWVATVSLYEADTEGLAPGDYYHELRVVDGGAPWTVATGCFHLYPSVAR